MAKVKAASRSQAAECETLISVCKAALVSDPTDERKIGALADALVKRAERIEYNHYNSHAHLKAAETLRKDADALREMQTRIIAGRKAIPDFEDGETYRQGDVVRFGDGIFQAKRGTGELPRRGPDWTLLAGKEVAVSPSPERRKASREWPVDPNLPKPAVPGPIRSEADREAYNKLMDYCINEAMLAVAKTGVPANSPATYDALTTLSGAIKALQEWIAQQISDVARRLDQLEASGIKFAGVWQRATGYRRGCVVTHQGSAWCAIRDHDEPEEPGKSDAWQLMVKRGADGKDAR